MTPVIRTDEQGNSFSSTVVVEGVNGESWTCDNPDHGYAIFMNCRDGRVGLKKVSYDLYVQLERYFRFDYQRLPLPFIGTTSEVLEEFGLPTLTHVASHLGNTPGAMA